MKVIYNLNYNMGLMGLEKLHPFDGNKFQRAWALLEQELGSGLTKYYVDVDRPLSDDELLDIHTTQHLQMMRQPSALAKAFEVREVALLRYSMLDLGFLTPMRWACRGSIIAARQALQHGFAINLGEGFHHAKPDRAEGFCLFSDIALIVAQLRSDGTLTDEQRVAYIDLDAHLGNGVAHCFLNDPRMFHFDMFNESIYPTSDTVAMDRVDCPIPVPVGCEGSQYLELLHNQLPRFLDSVTRTKDVGLVIYNAGTDVVAGDDLGLMSLTEHDVLERDQFVFQETNRRNLPTVMLLSGGYTEASHRLIANSVAWMCKAT